MTPWTAELQLERTALAWGRSWLSMIGASLLVARDGLVSGTPSAVLIATIAGSVWAALALSVHVRYRCRSRTLIRGGEHEVMLSATLAACATVLLSIAALLVLVL